MAERCGRLIAVEIDDRLYADLCVGFQGKSQVELVHKDFLRFQLPIAPYKVFGSIPYSRTAEIVRRLVDAPVPPEDAYLVVQREAAERFGGGPYAPETMSSLLLKPWWQVEIARRLRRTDFDPPPAVESVLLWLARRPRPLVQEQERSLYARFIGMSFGTRGSTLRQCLRGLFTSRQIARLSRDLAFDVSSRPSSLTFDQWLGLFRYLMLG